jgi:alpha-L-arabinofuranosidase
VPALLNNKPLSGQDSLYASAVIDKKTKEIIIKVVNGGAIVKQNTFLLDGIKKIAAQGTVTVLTGNPDQVNTVNNPFTVMPVVSSIAVKGKKITIVLQPLSLTIIKIAMQ